MKNIAIIALNALTAAELAAAVGSARVVNNCPFSVTLWSVGQNIAGPYTLGNQGSYGETFVRDPVTGGKALKMTKDPNGLYNGAPETIFSYNLDGSKIWYDLSDVFGDAFAGSVLKEASTNTACPAIVWPSGTPPGGSQVKNCGSDSDVVLTLCA
jgi:hypothetical protein